MTTLDPPITTPQGAPVHPGLFLPEALNPERDAGLWVPQAPGVWFRPLLLCASQGFYVNLLRVSEGGTMPRHRHAGAVHTFTLRGRWRYLEHDWEAIPGSYAFDPPGQTHTLVLADDVEEMLALFHVTGGYVYVYVDAHGHAEGYDDVFTKIEATRRHYISLGRNADDVQALVR
jgi:quercetin dioxygenase-like cupin family protein